MNDRPSRCGFLALVGRTNAGKSTLINHLVGKKINIVCHKVQTTRAPARGIVEIGCSQIILIDTPGFFETKCRLDRNMDLNPNF